ncbi:MAG: biotin transporter BioY [Candidatus Latescibacterota bacterium]
MAKNTKNLTLIALFAAIMALSSFLRLPIGPVPLTLQSTVALLCGYCLGPARGAAATLLYTVVGLAGIPVFASGGGPAYVLSPTFGYILGFTSCALVTGFLARLNTRNSAAIAYLLMLAGLAALYIPGVIWLSLSFRYFMGAPEPAVSIIRTGLVIPLLGDMVKTIPAAVIGVRLRPGILKNER